MYGLDYKTWKALLEVLSKYKNIEEIILYGSRAKGTFRNGSDIDLTLKGKMLTHDDLYRIMDEIDDLYLPYEVDLSLYESIENAELIEHIDRVGIRMTLK